MAMLRAGDRLPAHELTDLHGDPVRVPDPDRLVHLQFRRYAGCPICNLHLRSFTARHAELEAAGIHEVVVFHSDHRALAAHASDLPFDVVPDPAKRLYAEFGVERSLRAIAHPSTWLAGIRGWRPRLGIRSGPGGHFGLPADFLIASDGRVSACKYGEHANDQWSFDELLRLAADARR